MTKLYLHIYLLCNLKGSHTGTQSHSVSESICRHSGMDSWGTCFVMLWETRTQRNYIISDPVCKPLNGNQDLIIKTTKGSKNVQIKSMIGTVICLLSPSPTPSEFCMHQYWQLPLPEQIVPEYPGLQIQSKPDGVSRHWPLFWQGLVEQLPLRTVNNIENVWTWTWDFCL